MLFNSLEFIFFFIPITFFIFHLLALCRIPVLAKWWLVSCSLFFYGYWNFSYLSLILASISINYLIAHYIRKYHAKSLLIMGIILNIALLSLYKYTDFAISNFNAFFSTSIPLLHIGLPLAISFFTFQQISYLVDCYKKKLKQESLLSYMLYIVFFPQLIAGPIVYHSEILPQLKPTIFYKLNFKNVSLGFFIFSIGLFKKVILADQLSKTVIDGFYHLNSITFFDAWTVILSYTFQLYFDFSGYSDMAIGLALLFNIHLPINFYSPYKATNFQLLANTWHMTLSRFLNDYLFRPLNQWMNGLVFNRLPFRISTTIKLSINLFIIFLISGLWHGAGWNFIIWGCLFGLGVIIYRAWKNFKKPLHASIAWLITFMYINFILVFFRAESIPQAIDLIQALVGLNGFVLPEQLGSILRPLSHVGILFEATPLQNKFQALLLVIGSLIIVLFFKNSDQLKESFKPSLITLIFTVVLLTYAILNLTKPTIFLYFNF